MGKKSDRFAAGRLDMRRRAARGKQAGPVLLACEKCERRLAKEGRFRQIAQLQQTMDALAIEAQTDGSGLQILQVPCMDVCPKGAMAVANGAFPGDVQIVRTPEDLRATCAELISSTAQVTSEPLGAIEAVAPIDAR